MQDNLGLKLRCWILAANVYHKSAEGKKAANKQANLVDVKAPTLK